MRRIFPTAAFLSAVLFLLLATSTVLEVLLLKGTISGHFGRHTEYMTTSSGQIVSGTGEYFLWDGHGHHVISLYRIKLVPIISKEHGPDGRPIAALFDPAIIEVFKIRPYQMAAYCVLSAPLPAVWIARRLRRQSARGFPLDRLR